MVKTLVQAIRLPECLLVVVLGFLGFKIAGISPNNLVLVSLFFLIASTMLQNGWRDRFHDIAKGKTLARLSPPFFIPLLVIFWLTCMVLVSVVFTFSQIAALVLAGMLIIGLLYSEARHVPFLSIFLVTITVAGVTLLPLGFGASFSEVTPLMLLAFFLMFGRENLHDIADSAFDAEYKKTIPVMLGDKVARTMSLVSLVLGIVIAPFVSLATIPGMISVAIGLFWIQKEKSLLTARKFVDVGFALLAIGLLIA